MLRRWVSVITLAALATAAFATSVTFQVNMAVQQRLNNFAAGDTLVVRGNFNNWSGIANRLTAVGTDSIFRVTADVPVSAAEYKFVIARASGDQWESVPNRTLTVADSLPITVPAVYFNDQSVIGYNMEVFFRVNMAIQISNGNFSPANDWVVVRGGAPELGNWGGAVARLLEETGNPGMYSAWISVNNMAPGAGLEYKFVYLTGADPAAAHWEQVPGGANRVVTATGTETDLLPPPSGNGRRELYPNPATVYFSNVTPQDVTVNPVTVYVPWDLRPAYGKLNTPGEYIIDVQSGDTVFAINNVNLAGFFNNWPWGAFPATDNANDNGTNGDLVAGDSIWTARHLFPAGSDRNFTFKGGINGYDVEAGFAQNHTVVLVDSNPNFRIPNVCFGSSGTLYTAWQNRCINTGIHMDNPDVPNSFELAQNFPNPFNPSTSVRFTMPVRAEVTFEVFDVMGRSVLKEKLGLKNPGSYTLSFDGTALSSGTYFYKVSAGSNFAVRQMMLMK